MASRRRSGNSTAVPRNALRSGVPRGGPRGRPRRSELSGQRDHWVAGLKVVPTGRRAAPPEVGFPRRTRPAAGWPGTARPGTENPDTDEDPHAGDGDSDTEDAGRRMAPAPAVGCTASRADGKAGPPGGRVRSWRDQPGELGRLVSRPRCRWAEPRGRGSHARRRTPPCRRPRGRPRRYC